MIDSSSLLTGQAHACQVTNDTGSNESLAFAKRCILSCQEHAICAVEMPPFRPTRILDVKKVSSASNEIRLVETTDLPASHPLSYIALSHCWGGKIDYKLLESNLQDMKGQINISSLARNFRDAISITRMLGERYLWIDSLCIIQDSVSDWETESSQMGQLYANSTCTISATASKNSEGGCILPKELFFNDCTLRKQDKHSLVVRSWVHQDSSLDDLFPQKVDLAALNKRAWTFQEKILSRRVLNFCDGILLFECNTHRASEYHAEGVQHKVISTVQRDGTQNFGPRRIEHPAVERGRKYITRKIKRKRAPGIRTRYHSSTSVTYLNPNYSFAPGHVEVEQSGSALLGFRGAYDMLTHVKRPVETTFQRLEIHRRWYELVGLYSARELTKQKDKMMAILGLGYAIEMSTGLSFVAGLWEEAMCFNLLWIALGDPKPRPVRDVPTWSWASVDQIIDEIICSASIKKYESLVTHLDIKHINPFIEHNSLIHHASLVLSGHLTPLDESSENFHPDIIILDDDIGGEIEHLPILSFINGLAEIEVHGIAVRETSAGNTIYERVGYFWTKNNFVTKDILDNVDQKREFVLV
ncbi:hypothetical protein IFR05_003822 [Cadophora sp. M221]|nr:hypothetical protein IFR05_003822 [Cadophora sp. M221]